MDRHTWLELQLTGLPGLSQAGQPADQAAEGFLELYPGQLSAGAVMHAGAEGQMAGRVAGDVEPVRITDTEGSRLAVPTAA